MSKEWFIKAGGQVCLKAGNGELNGWDAQSLVDCLNGKELKIADLEAKLAESENLNKRLYSEKESAEKILRMTSDEQTREILALKEQLTKKDKELSTRPTMQDLYPPQLIKLANQNKISLVVAELERAKIEFETYYADNIWNYPQYLEDRIAELTHQHEDKGE